jgi:imidazolonepropionase-like amidohydrolase
MLVQHPKILTLLRPNPALSGSFSRCSATRRFTFRAGNYSRCCRALPGGKIVSVGTTKDALRDPWLKKNRKKVVEIDCGGRVVLPGFVDSHTHPVHAPAAGGF